MLNLVLKDLIVQKISYLYAVIFSMVMFAAFGATTYNSGAYIMAAVASAYMFMVWAIGYDEKNKCEVMLNSLPLKRHHIVISKYISAAAFVFISIAISAMVGVLFKVTGILPVQRLINIWDIAGAFLSVTVLSILYFPAYFKLGYLKSRMATMIIYLAVFFAPGMVTDYIRNNYSRESTIEFISFLISMPSSVILALIFGFIMFLTLVSIMLSIKFYRAREF